nr:MAG TPA: REGULATORY PROTEIN, LYSR, DNA-BINDING, TRANSCRIPTION, TRANSCRIPTION [Caudoviricetes sp.]
MDTKPGLFWLEPKLRKLFKTPIFERWGKQICLNE